MAESQQGPSEDWMSLVNFDSPFLDSSNQPSQQEALGWIGEFNTPTHGNIDPDHQAGQQAQDGLCPSLGVNGGCIPQDVVNPLEELELLKQRDFERDTRFQTKTTQQPIAGSAETNFASSDQVKSGLTGDPRMGDIIATLPSWSWGDIPVANPDLLDEAVAVDDSWLMELFGTHIDHEQAGLNFDPPDSGEHQHQAPTATLLQSSESHFTKATSLNARVNPDSTVNDLAIEHETVSDGLSQATAMFMPKETITPPDRPPAYFPAMPPFLKVAEQGGYSHDTRAIRRHHTAAVPHLYPEQSQLSSHAISIGQERPMRRKRAASELGIPGCRTIDLVIQTSAIKKPRKMKTKEQLEITKIVKSRGACLRCRMEKQKCSGNDPCESCVKIFARAYTGQHLRWTACVRPSLTDKNVFAHGITLPENFKVQSSKASYIGVAFLEEWWSSLSCSASAPATKNFEETAIFLDNLYGSALKYAGGYDEQSCQRRLSLIRNRNAFNVLLQSNTILLSKAIIGDHIGDNEEYVRQLRALASTNALTALETALRPRTLEKFAEPSKRKITSLIVFIALTLDILLSVPTNGLLTPASSNNKAHCSMHEQLGLLLVHYLRHLCSKAFSPSSSLLSCFGNASGNVTLSGSFWSTLASERLPEPSVTDSGGEPQSKTDSSISAFRHSPAVERVASGEIAPVNVPQRTIATPRIARQDFEKLAFPPVSDLSRQSRPDPVLLNLGASSNQDRRMYHSAQLVVTSSTLPNYGAHQIAQSTTPVPNRRTPPNYRAHQIAQSTTPVSPMEQWLAEDQTTSPWTGFCSHYEDLNLDDVNVALKLIETGHSSGRGNRHNGRIREG